jgi:hypothetical protein
MAITIKRILEAEVGEKFGGIELTVKTVKKKWDTGKETIQQVVFSDTTGDILADIKLAKGKYGYDTIIRNSPIKIVVAEIQASENSKKLYVDQYIRRTVTEPEITPYDGYMNGIEPIEVIRSKIKCWQVAAKIETGASLDEVLEYIRDDKFKQIIDEIMKG